MLIVKNTIDINCKKKIKKSTISEGSDKIFTSIITSSKNLKDSGMLVNKNHTIIITTFNFGAVFPIPKQSLVLLVLNLMYIKSFKKNSIKLFNVCNSTKYTIIFKFIKLVYITKNNIKLIS